jgi:hypothetical protein
VAVPAGDRFEINDAKLAELRPEHDAGALTAWRWLDKAYDLDVPRARILCCMCQVASALLIIDVFALTPGDSNAL